MWCLFVFLLFQIEIVQQGSSAGSDLFLLFGGTLCCLAWLLYGYLLNDVFVYVSGDVRIRYYNCYCCYLIRKQFHQCFEQILITVNRWGHHRSGRSTLLILHSNHPMWRMAVIRDDAAKTICLFFFVFFLCVFFPTSPSVMNFVSLFALVCVWCVSVYMCCGLLGGGGGSNQMIMMLPILTRPQTFSCGDLPTVCCSCSSCLILHLNRRNRGLAFKHSICAYFNEPYIFTCFLRRDRIYWDLESTASNWQ